MRLRVDPAQAGKRLLQFLRDHLPHAPSVKAIKRAIESKQCRINGRVETFSTYMLKVGDVVELEIESAPSIQVPSILYEDEDFIICNKPAGVVSDNKLAASLGKCSLVHRLDKETSGALILAKSEEVRKLFIALFEQQTVEKSYLAIVDKEVSKDSGKIETFLSKKHSYQGQTIYGSGGQGDHALTFWKCLKRGKDASLLSCSPKTGRTHQLRVHLKEMGHPILGDSQYARHFVCSYPARRHMLHASSLSFPHPKTGKIVSVVAPLPEDFSKALTALGLGMKI